MHIRFSHAKGIGAIQRHRLIQMIRGIFSFILKIRSHEKTLGFSKGFSTLLHFAMSSYKHQSVPAVTRSKGTLASSTGDRLKFRFSIQLVRAII